MNSNDWDDQDVSSDLQTDGKGNFNQQLSGIATAKIKDLQTLFNTGVEKPRYRGKHREVVQHRLSFQLLPARLRLSSVNLADAASWTFLLFVWRRKNYNKKGHLFHV